MIGVAFDKFDRFVETLTGKDTLFNTVGIGYQSPIQQLHPCLNNSIDSSANFERGVERKRNDQEEITLEVDPTPKKRS